MQSGLADALNFKAAANPKSTDLKTNFKAYLCMYLEHYAKSELRASIDHLKAHSTSTSK